jgi:hypothetical protein
MASSPNRIVKTAARRVFRAGIQKTRKIVERMDPERVSGNAFNRAFAYASINQELMRLIAENPTVLYPQYTWGVLQAAHLARALGMGRISVAEFGVAGGNGLVALEVAAEKVEAIYGVRIDVHGFDTGKGLPKPIDYRDLPHGYREFEYVMDVDKLRSRLQRAQLHIGLVAETVVKFLEGQPAPVAFVSFDLDYYSSTVDAFKIFEADHRLLLPRVHCYFDDIMGMSYSEYTGERLAIVEFNQKCPTMKVSPIFGLKYFLPPTYARSQWSEMFYHAHFFRHPLYGHNDGLVLDAERPLRSAENVHPR